MKSIKRFVFDTNVLISAMLFKDGKPRKALRKALKTGTVTVSDETLEELDKVLRYKRFNKYAPLETRKRSVRFFKKITENITVSEKVALCRDPDDDKFLSLAKAAKAVAIVTGDDDLLVLNPFDDIAILTPDKFLNLKL